MVDNSHALTVRLDDATYEALRREAYERHVPMNFIIIEALRARLPKPEVR